MSENKNEHVPVEQMYKNSIIPTLIDNIESSVDTLPITVVATRNISELESNGADLIGVESIDVKRPPELVDIEPTLAGDAFHPCTIDGDDVIFTNKQERQPSRAVVFRDTPLELRHKLGPYLVVCGEHYLERRRVPNEFTSEANDNHYSSEYSSSQQQQSLFLPSSDESKAGDHFVDKINTQKETSVVVDESNVAGNNDDCRNVVQTIENVDESRNVIHTDRNEDESRNVIHAGDDGDSDQNQINCTYTSRTLIELEDATKNWFLGESNRGLSPVQKDKQKDTIELFSLQFNETTVSTIAQWVAGGPKRRIPNATSHRPIVDTRFHRCCICSMFGHFEVECKQITPEQTIHFSKHLAVGINDNEPPMLNQKQYDVTIEMCDGYLIEQRSCEEGKDVRFNQSGQPTTDVSSDGMLDGHNVVNTVRIPNRTVQIDDFIIHDGATIESLSDLPTMNIDTPIPLSQSTSVYIDKGCLVTWIVHTDDAIADSLGIFAVGTVSDFDAELDLVQVKVQRIIEKTNHLTTSQQQQLPTIDSLVWLPSKLCFYINGRNHLLPIDKIPTRKRRANRYMKKVVPEKKTQSKLSKKRLMEKKRAVQDKKLHSAGKKKYPVEGKKKQSMQSLPTTKTGQIESGPSKRPRGTKPCGLKWNEIEGVWVLPAEEV